MTTSWLDRLLAGTGRFAWCLIVSALLAGAAHAGPYIWDTDEDRVDDRIESVNLLGFEFSFELSDTLLRQRIDVSRDVAGLLYGVYVVWDHEPTTTDLLALTANGMPVLHRVEAVPATRHVCTFLQATWAAELPGVERVEAVPLLYPCVRDGAAAIGAADPTERVFPTWAGTRPETGNGVVVAFLDTGINDAPDGSYPGHEALAGRCVGGAEITHGNAALDTPIQGSVNPVDRGGALTSAHGTHVAAIAVGSGGPTGFARGIAPGAAFVDVKVLGDAGNGTALPEALDWCIANRARDWGSSNPDEVGIDVLNLSLSSIDQTDGNDLASRLARRAVELGIVVVASMGNESRVGETPSPAGGDGVLAVGAWDVQRTGDAGDDQYPAFNTYGPRASDQDGDALDEMKPDLLAPGVAVLSADGDLGSDGDRYRRATGTSMAAAFVTGSAALLRAAQPSLTPASVATLLRGTARRDLAGLPPGASGADPRWLSPRGFGVLDLYAAEREWVQPDRSQIRRLVLGAMDTTVHAELWTMRERNVARFVFESAADAGGVPGPFAALDSVEAAGDSSLADVVNLTRYPRTWSVAPAERGTKRWYRIAWVESGVRYESPARRLALPSGAPAATIEVTIAHDAYDHDVTAWVEPWVATAAGAAATGSHSAPTFPLPATTGAESWDYVSGTSTTGTQAWRFRVEVPAGAADAHLPPSGAQPWALRVQDAGFLNRSGRVLEYRLIWHGPSGDVTYVGEPTPLLTLEGQTVAAYAPGTLLDVGARTPAAAMIAGPNPVRRGASVTFTFASARGGEATSETIPSETVPSEVVLYDVTGRRVGRVSLAPAGDGRVMGRWSTRDEGGHPLPAGLYLARFGREGSLRIAVLPR